MRRAQGLQAHDKWVCLGCRWTAKIPLVDARAANRPSYRCPRCRANLVWTGTAFRPPRKDDDEGWKVLEKLFATGFRFHSTRRRVRVPRTLKDLDAWLKAGESPGGWLAERRVRIRRDAGRTVVRCGQEELANDQQVIVWHDGDWLEGRLRISYGVHPLPNPVVTVTRPRRIVALRPGMRVRIRSRRTA